MNSPNELCDRIRHIAYDIHVCHAQGHLEEAYENTLALRLRKAGLAVKQRHPIEIFDAAGSSLGHHLADLLVEDSVVVELKIARPIAPNQPAQVPAYLEPTRLEHGLLISF